MSRQKLLAGSVLALTIGATTLNFITPAAAWCRWGRCGWGWGGPVAAGIVAGTAVGVAAAAARPYPYYAPGGYYVCPPGYHLGRYGRACWAN